MKDTYKRIIAHMRVSGARLRQRAGKIADIGVTKQYLTEEDIRIERELKQIVMDDHPDHAFYSEEENDTFVDAENVWIADPISGTQIFLDGLSHYGIVIAHLFRGQVVFSAVYDPSTDELYTAYRGSGAFLNDQKILVRESDNTKPRVIINFSSGWKGETHLEQIVTALKECDVYRLMYSHALSGALVAAGKFHGVICFGKDSFPYFSSSLLISEAGGVFTNIAGEHEIKSSDRLFIGGNTTTYPILKTAIDALKLQ